MKYKIFASLCIGFATAIVPAVTRGEFVLPQATEGSSGGNGTIFQNSSTNAQWAFSSSLLGSVLGQQITGIAFRLNGGEVSLPTAPNTIATWDLRISKLLPSVTLPLPPSINPLSAIDNSDVVNVFNGTVSFSANAFPGNATPNAFGPTIVFTTPYTYTGGNLLFTLTNSGPTDFGNALPDVDGNAFADANQSFRLGNDTAGAPIVSLTTAAVPEPSAFLLVGAVAIAAMWATSRQSSSAERLI